MYSYQIEQDFDPINPRVEWDNFGTMFCQHRRYDLGDKGAQKPDLGACIWLPLYLYDHSGLTIQTAPFSCPWDSGQVGYIYVEKEKARRAYGVKRLSAKLQFVIKSRLEAEVKTYDRYLTGDTWGYIIEEDGEEIDACWGFFGREYCEEEAAAQVEYYKAEHFRKYGEQLNLNL